MAKRWRQRFADRKPQRIKDSNLYKGRQSEFKSRLFVLELIGIFVSSFFFWESKGNVIFLLPIVSIVTAIASS